MDEQHRGAPASGPEVRFTVRVEPMGPHSHVRTFANGALTGTLIMRHEEAAAYALRLAGIACPVCRGGPLLGGCERCHGAGKVLGEDEHRRPTSGSIAASAQHAPAAALASALRAPCEGCRNPDAIHVNGVCPGGAR